jgi:segregation and condensation protein B
MEQRSMPERPTAEEEYRRAIEAVVLVAHDPVPPELLAQLLECPVADVERRCDELAAGYAADSRGFELVRVAGGYRFQTHPDLAPYVERFVLHDQRVRLSGAALETLAIVAYKQPVSRPEIDAVRGVNSEATLDNLLERRLVRIAGRKEAPGRPFVYETTREFLIAFGLRDVGALPKIEGELVIPVMAGAEGEHAEAQAQQDPGASGAEQPAGS